GAPDRRGRDVRRSRRAGAPALGDGRGRGRGAAGAPVARGAGLPDRQRGVAPAPRGLRPVTEPTSRAGWIERELAAWHRVAVDIEHEGDETVVPHDADQVDRAALTPPIRDGGEGLVVHVPALQE